MNRLASFIMGFVRGVFIAGGVLLILVFVLRLVVSVVWADEPYGGVVTDGVVGGLDWPPDTTIYPYGYPDPYVEELLGLVADLDIALKVYEGKTTKATPYFNTNSASIFKCMYAPQPALTTENAAKVSGNGLNAPCTADIWGPKESD